MESNFAGGMVEALGENIKTLHRSCFALLLAIQMPDWGSICFPDK